jgi:ABC-type multidrug transport system ATPase subunit
VLAPPAGGNELLLEQPEITAPARPLRLPHPPRGQIAFQNVSFAYPSRPEVAALEDFSLSVEPGETVAIVGPSGAGKFTSSCSPNGSMIRTARTVRIDGVPLPQADPAEVRARMALVPQEGVPSAASGARQPALWQLGRQRRADLGSGRTRPMRPRSSRNCRRPRHLLGEDGARLSGGQRQRIAIARALLRDAPILLLDEATSALDAESERLVQDALDRLMKARTTLVIAHRLATVRAADRIVVMDKGRIVEQGTHTALSAQDGLDAGLARLQFDSAEADPTVLRQTAPRSYCRALDKRRAMVSVPVNRTSGTDWIFLSHAEARQGRDHRCLAVRARYSPRQPKPILPQPVPPKPGTAKPAVLDGYRIPTFGGWGMNPADIDRTVKPGDDFFADVNGKLEPQRSDPAARSL